VFAFFCVCVQVEALRRADHPSKECYRLSLIKTLRNLSPMLQTREQRARKKNSAAPNTDLDVQALYCHLVHLTLNRSILMLFNDTF
jgi:hypothetical protein